MFRNPNSNADAMRTILDRQRAAALAEAPWDASQRIELLEHAADLLVNHEQVFVAVLEADFGAHLAQIRQRVSTDSVASVTARRSSVRPDRRSAA